MKIFKNQSKRSPLDLILLTVEPVRFFFVIKKRYICINSGFIDSPAPASPVVSDQVIQTYKSTIEQQSTQIKSLEEKLSDLEISLQALVCNYIFLSESKIK